MNKFNNLRWTFTGYLHGLDNPAFAATNRPRPAFAGVNHFPKFPQCHHCQSGWPFEPEQRPSSHRQPPTPLRCP